MKVDVFFNSKWNSFLFGEMPVRNNLKLVASIDTKSIDQIAALNEAYELSQNIDGSWTKNKQVKTNETAIRSVSIGDVFKINDDTFIVDKIGFLKVVL